MQIQVNLVTIGLIDPIALRNSVFALVQAAITGGTLLQPTDSGNVTLVIPGSNINIDESPAQIA
jgi:hypothetical protein